VSARVELLLCPSCGAGVPLGATDVASCAYCGTQVPLGPAHLEAVRLAAEVRRANERLFAELAALFAGGLRPTLFKLVSAVPFALFALQIALFVYGVFLSDLDDFFSDEIVNEFLMEDHNFALAVVLPSALLTIGAAFLTRKNAYVADVRFLFELFAPKTGEKGALCRSCESPLRVERTPDLVVCPYCGTENVAAPGAESRQRIAGLLGASYLEDLKALHADFARTYNRYFFGVTAGIVFLYGLFFAFTWFWEHPRHIPGVAQYALTPFFAAILLMLVSGMATLPHQRFDDWMRRFFGDKIGKGGGETEKERRTLGTWLFYALNAILPIAFFVSMFFLD
jgi:hypothetical protein